MDNLLSNYMKLTEMVDSLAERIRGKLRDSITCHKGCSGCCSAITLFPVEAAAIRRRIESLPLEISEQIREKTALESETERCPLLEDDCCLIYENRPIICRTHGLPIIFDENGTRRLDCCPLNSIQGEKLEGESIIDLDRVNHLLVAVNALFLKERGVAGESSQRVTIAVAVAGESGSKGKIT